MSCQNPISIFSPETRWLRKCRKEKRPFEYYLHQANQRRNLLFDPIPLVDNPYDYYSPQLHEDVRWVKVPCGKCDLCLKRKINDIFVMSYYEFLGCKFLRNGSCWFITLTYGDELLPKLPDGTPCFSVYHLQLFLKRLRKLFDFPIRYLLVSEYGGEFGRPHYHGLLFIDKFSPCIDEIDKFKFQVLEKVAKSWTRIDDRNYKYSSMNHLGFFDVQRVDVQFVDNNRVLRYVSKYCGKQIGSVDFDSRLDVPSEFRRRTLHSIDFGSNYIDFCNQDVWKTGKIEVDSYKYSLPNSWRVKVLREYYCALENGNIVYRPSDFSYQYFENLCYNQILEHKKLAICNKSYPKLPSWVYDPLSLERFLDFCRNYVIFREVRDVDLEISLFINDWQDFLIEVQKFNKSHYDALAIKWKNQQKEYYLRKTKRKC